MCLRTIPVYGVVCVLKIQKMEDLFPGLTAFDKTSVAEQIPFSKKKKLM